MFKYTLHYFLFDASRKQIINNFSHNYPETKLINSVKNLTGERLTSLTWDFDGQHDGNLTFTSDYFISYTGLYHMRVWVQKMVAKSKLYIGNQFTGPTPDLLYIDKVIFATNESDKLSMSDNDGQPIISPAQIDKLLAYVDKIDDYRIKLYSDIDNWFDEGAVGRAKLDKYQPYVDQISFDTGDDQLNDLIANLWESTDVANPRFTHAQTALEDVGNFDDKVNELLNNASFLYEYAA